MTDIRTWGSSCVVCGGDLSEEEINVREMMFGTGESFVYRQCRVCESLQISQLPDNLGKYYPSGYYAYASQTGVIDSVGKNMFRLRVVFREVPALHTFARAILSAYVLKTNEQKMVNRLSPPPTSRVLDVGCGAGKTLRVLRFLGYSNLVGIDPYLGDAVYEPGLRLLKKELGDVDGQFDIIIFNHTLEHIPWPAQTLSKASSLLSSGGFAVLAIPVTRTYAWHKYRENWVQIDAPRHVFIPSVSGLRNLATHCGFRLKELIHDSTEFQFWGSEQYLNGTSLTSQESYGVNSRRSRFTSKHIKAFRKMAKELNRRGQGDQVMAILEKT